VLGDFEIRREVGRGGMGTVYEAWQVSLRRTVALKVLSPHVSISPQAVARFQREAQAAAKLHHPHIVPIFAQGREEDLYYYAMEFVEGLGLNAIIARARGEDIGSHPTLCDLDETVAIRPTTDGAGEESTADTTDRVSGAHPSGALDETVSTTPPPQLALSDSHVVLPVPPAGGPTMPEHFEWIARQIAAVADALHYAHQHGVIHRDIKPHNLLMGPDGRLRVSDFGLARLSEQPGVTITGEFLGSPLYMSSEQITRGPAGVDHRTDIYSLGATLYEWLTLSPPFPAETREQVITRILTTDAQPARSLNAAVPVNLETICLKALERDPNNRYQSAQELRDDLLRFAAQDPIHARRAGYYRRTRRFISRRPVAVVLTLAMVIAAFLGRALLVSQRELERQADDVREARKQSQAVIQQNQDILDLLKSMSIEGQLLAMTVQGGLPVVKDLLATGVSAPAANGPPPEAVPAGSRRIEGLGRHLVEDFHALCLDLGSGADPAGEAPGTPEPPLEGEASPAERFRLARETLEHDPGDIPARHLCAALACETGQYGQMMDHADALVRLHPDDAASYMWRALASLLTEADESVLQDLATAEQDDRMRAWVAMVRSLLALRHDQFAEAVSGLSQALEGEDPPDAAWLARGAAYAAWGHYEEAVADLTRVLDVHPQHTDALVLRGQSYSYLGRYSEAAEDFRGALDVGGPSPALKLQYLLAVSRQVDASTGPPATGTEQQAGDKTVETEVEDDAAGDKSAADRAWDLLDSLFRPGAPPDPKSPRMSNEYLPSENGNRRGAAGALGVIPRDRVP
jgi:serine/threonine protein kinase/tetratricopeptide (TPR) repeat protein